MLCQATRIERATVELPSQSPDGSYHLSADAAARLQYFALRPREWFNLATIHGPFEHYLHDDFYTEEGEACQPKRDVTESGRFPCPTLNECAGDLQKLLDFAGTRWHLQQSVIDRFRFHTTEILPAVNARFDRTKNPWFHERYAALAAQVIEQKAESWFRGVLDRFEPVRRLRLLEVGYKCLRHDDGLALAKVTLSHLHAEELARWCTVLAHFRDPSSLDWIEDHVHVPLTGQWGDLAAASSFDWDRASKWLQADRPLSLVALDAMVACSGPHPSQSFLIQKIRPRMRAEVSAEVIQCAISDYAARDCSPRVSKSARHIIATLPVILSA